MPDDKKTLVPTYSVTVDGAVLPDNITLFLQWIEIRQSIRLIDMAVLCFENPGGTVGDNALFKHGKEIEVELGYLGEIKWVFKGDIVSVEPEFPMGAAPMVQIRAYDRLHRYRRGRKQRTFLNQKVSDVVTTLASEDGLSPDVEDTKLQHEYLLQNNQTNIDYIHELGRRHGYEVEVTDRGKKLFFKRPRYDQGKAHTLSWLKELKGFYVRKSVDNVPTEVQCRYWDMKQKKAITEKHDKVHGELEAIDVGPKEANKAFGKAEVLISLRQNVAPAEAKALAESVFNELALESVKGRGSAVGDTKIVPGMVLELLNLGTTWSGLYYVVATTQLYDRRSGYTTEFEVRRTGTGYAAKSEFIQPAAAGASAEPAESKELGATLSHG